VTNLEGALEPYLATEVATVENGRVVITGTPEEGQRAEISLTLRDDIVWSDGQPITTADVAFTYEMSRAPGFPLPTDNYDRRTVEVQDDKNFTVIIEPAQSSDFVASPIDGPLPEHVMRAAWDDLMQTTAGLDPEADAAQLVDAYREFFSGFGSSAAINEGRTVYSGPFVPTRWTAGSALQMTRNPEFHMHPDDQDAYVQSVEYRFITDTNALQFSVVTGAVDVTSSVGITFDQALSPQLRARAADRYDVWFIPSPVWEHLDVNQFSNVQQVADNQLDDVRTRRAILHAIDRDAMVEALFDGLQPVSHSNVSPYDPLYNPDVPQYAYDPERSMELLAELGWTRGSDGILQRTTADGRNVRFELEFVTTAGNAVRERIQQFIGEDLRQIGIDVRINNAPSNVVFSSDFINRAYDGSFTGMFMFAWSVSQAGSLNAQTYLCESAPTPQNNYSGQNAGGACSPRYDELREQAVAELDLAVSRPIYQEMQAVYAEELLAIPLYFRSNPVVVAQGVVNFVASTFSRGFGYPPFRPELVGWTQNGAVQQFDPGDYALQLED
jgi:peptide/nickel transport system substrate-binding protein